MSGMLVLLFVFIFVIVAIAAKRLPATSWAPFNITPHYVVLAFYNGAVVAWAFICAPIFVLFAIADALTLSASD